MKTDSSALVAKFLSPGGVVTKGPTKVATGAKTFKRGTVGTINFKPKVK